MKLKLLFMLVVASSGLMAGEARMPEEMLRSKNQQYQDGFRDGFREAVRMMNSSGGSSHGDSGRKIQIYKAIYGSTRGRCDFTNRLARAANDKTSYRFQAGNQWCGDPSDGFRKVATVSYSCRGKMKQTFVREGQSELLRCH
ncbi:MAG: hypothetical protein ACRCU9_12400 [Iodobacter sp.]